MMSHANRIKPSFTTNRFLPHPIFGPLRHNYERIVPTFCSTFFTNFLLPLTYEQLEAREGSLGAAYCPDLLDLLFLKTKLTKEKLAIPQG